MKADIFIIGGAGHIGLPLGLLFADKGKKVILYDKNKKNIKKINNLEMPFMEKGGEKLLKKSNIPILQIWRPYNLVGTDQNKISDHFHNILIF